MVTLIQGTRPVGLVVPRKTDIGDKFQRLNPPIFWGRAGADPCESEYWIEQVEKIFRFIGCQEEDKVNYATFMLRDEVDH